MFSNFSRPEPEEPDAGLQAGAALLPAGILHHLQGYLQLWKVPYSTGTYRTYVTPPPPSSPFSTECAPTIPLQPLIGSVADPESGIRYLFDPWIRDPGSRMNNLDNISEILETIFWVRNLISLLRIRDGKNSDPGSGINIPDPQHCL